MIIEHIYWSALVFIFYTYIGYLLLLRIILEFKNHPVNKGDIVTNVSIIITAYNEEKRIKEKIENTLRQNYRQDKLEIIIASDCSTDDTDNIIKSYQSTGVQLVRVHERKGKEYAQKQAVDIANGDIFIFTDVSTTLDVSAIYNIVKNFNDPTVGCVSSVDRFIDREGNISGEGAYVRYEMFLRKLESNISTLVGLSGSFFAARKEVCHPWATDIPSDFNTLLNAVKKGYRGVSDSESIGYYHDILDKKKEFSRKVRTVTRGIKVFMKNLSVLNIYKYGIFSLQIFSHKLCRWLVPYALLIVLVSNAFLIDSSIYYLIFFGLQAIFYCLAAVGISTGSNKKILKFPSYFVLVNLSIFIAWLKYFKGEHYTKWEPSTR